jgi:hypothetical protein
MRTDYILRQMSVKRHFKSYANIGRYFAKLKVWRIIDRKRKRSYLKRNDRNRD